MKKIILGVLCFAACIIIMITACKTDKKTTKSVEREVYDQTTLPLIDPSNPDNPYDVMGKLHNKGMDIVGVTFAKGLEKGLSLSEIKIQSQRALIRMMEEEGYLDAQEFKPDEKYLAYHAIPYDKRPDLYSYAREVNILSPALSNIILPFSEYFGTVSKKFYDSSINTVELLMEIKSKALSVEKMVKEGTTLSGEEKIQALTYFAIFRHSLVYHVSNIKDLSSPWFKVCQWVKSKNTDPIAQKTWTYYNGFFIYADWIKINGQDAIWGLSGAGGGSMGGIAGAIVGGIFGALGGSAGELYNEMIDGGVIILDAGGWQLWP